MSVINYASKTVNKATARNKNIGSVEVLGKRSNDEDGLKGSTETLDECGDESGTDGGYRVVDAAKVLGRTAET